MSDADGRSGWRTPKRATHQTGPIANSGAARIPPSFVAISRIHSQFICACSGSEGYFRWKSRGGVRQPTDAHARYVLYNDRTL